MIAYLLKDNNEHIYGYRRGYTNNAFDITNDVFIMFNNYSWALEVAEALNKPQLGLALPITVLEIEIL